MPDDEEDLLRSVALQNAKSILLARQRAEQEMLRAKDELERRTQELVGSLAMMRATLESTWDGILVTDARGRVTHFNRRYVDMWRLPRETMETMEHRRILEFTCRQFKESQPFLARTEEIYAASQEESLDVLELADRRVFERFSGVQSVDGRNVGRVWSFRDITATSATAASRCCICPDIHQAALGSGRKRRACSSPATRSTTVRCSTNCRGRTSASTSPR